MLILVCSMHTVSPTQFIPQLQKMDEFVQQQQISQNNTRYFKLYISTQFFRTK
jgi:hypothetical protein